MAVSVADQELKGLELYGFFQTKGELNRAQSSEASYLLRGSWLRAQHIAAQSARS